MLWRWKKLFCGILALISALVSLLLFLGSGKYGRISQKQTVFEQNLGDDATIREQKIENQKALPTDENCSETIRALRNRLLLAAKQVARAHKHARSSKTLLELENAFQTLSAGLDSGNSELSAQKLTLADNALISPNKENLSQPGQQVDVCPEFWAGIQYPFYEDRFKMNCTGLEVKPFKDVLTVLLNFAGEIPIASWRIIAGGFSKGNYGDLKIVAGLHEKDKESFDKTAQEFGLNFEVVAVDATDTLGKSLMKILNQVQTKYVFLGRNLTRMDDYSRLERLVRLLSYINADFVSGSHRNSTGHWELGCYQMAVKNYTVRLVEGYDLAYNSCIYCDYVSGPFAVRSDLLRSRIDDPLDGESFYANLWLESRDKSVIMNCPDAMFHSEPVKFAEEEKTNWLGLVKKHELNKFVFPDGTEMYFSCSDLQHTCKWPEKGLLHPVCCFEELTNLLVHAARTFEANGIHYELEGGSLVGAVKIGGSLPWELDHDFNLRAQNITSALKLTEQFQKLGYKLFSTKDHTKCVENFSEINCGYLGLSSATFRIEMWGLNELSNDVWLRQGLPFTKAKVAGQWMNVYASPAAAARNQYNDDIFKHAEHWVTLGHKSGWDPYKVGEFSECPRPGFHGCLSGNYLAVGNLQFKEIWI